MAKSATDGMMYSRLAKPTRGARVMGRRQATRASGTEMTEPDGHGDDGELDVLHEVGLDLGPLLRDEAPLDHVAQHHSNDATGPGPGGAPSASLGLTGRDASSVMAHDLARCGDQALRQRACGR